jgi:membrane-bound ClpP family serine protease
MNVIDLISPSLPALLRTIDGRVTTPRHLTLHTAGAQIVDETGLLHPVPVHADRPEHRSLLFLAGLAGPGFELFHPGVVIPARSARSAWCARSSASVLPLSWAG